MTQELVFGTIIGILIFDFLFENFLEFLNTRAMKAPIPEELKGIYDPEKYVKQQNYHRENRRLGILSGTLSFLITLAMFLFYGFAYIDRWVGQQTDNPIVAALLFFGVIMLGSGIISLPFSVYDTFVIEEKYGFNKTTPKTFVLDLFKGALLSAIIGGGLLALIVFLWQKTGEWFWLLAWAVVAAFSLFMSLFYSSLIVPLFNMQTPLEEGELRDAIAAFARKVNFKLDNIFVIDGSKRSTKANAYFTGLGAKKRIVLYDTLIKELSTDELVAVLAHEIGHNKKKHMVQGLLLGILQMGLVFWLLGLFIDSPVLSQALGVENPNFHIGLVAFGVLYSPLLFFTGIFMNVLSRRNEYQADGFAAKYFKPSALMTALKTLAVNNFSNLTPHPWYVFFHYSHPTLLQRLRFMASFDK